MCIHVYGQARVSAMQITFVGLQWNSTTQCFHFFSFKEKFCVNSVALISLSLGQSLCIRLKAYYTPLPPFYVMPMLPGTGPNGPQTPPLSLHSVWLVQTCNVHLKNIHNLSSSAIAITNNECGCTICTSEWCQQLL